MTDKLTPAEKSKLYRERNPERFRDSLKRYWAKKKTCECGAVITNKIYPSHKRTNKHISKMKLIEYEKLLENMRKQPNKQEEEQGEQE